MLRLCRYQGRPRQWIAAAATFVLSLHLVLGSLAIGRLAAGQAGGDTFVICHGDAGSSPTEQDGPAKQPDVGSHCILCTLTNSGCAILPTTSAIVAFVPGAGSIHLARQDAQVNEHHSPTGRFQRGPPLSTVVAG